MKRALLVLLCLFLISALFNQPSSKLKPVGNYIELTGRIWVLKTSTNIRTIDDVTVAEVDVDFLPIDGNYVNLAKNHELWLKIDLTDLTITSLQGYVFEIERNAIIRPAEIYYQTKLETWQQKPLLSKPQYLNRLLTSFPTLGKLIQKTGTQTAHFGKWHLGDNYPHRPEDRGFDEAIWFPSSHLNGVSDYWDNDYFDDFYNHNGRREKFKGYCTDVFTNEAINWMQKKIDKKESKKKKKEIQIE